MDVVVGRQHLYDRCLDPVVEFDIAPSEQENRCQIHYLVQPHSENDIMAQPVRLLANNIILYYKVDFLIEIVLQWHQCKFLGIFYACLWALALGNERG